MPTKSKSNNPTGRNQYSNDWMSAVKDRPFTTAATAAAAVGAGVFLWSKRNQISEQISSLSDQISDWTESMRSGEDSDLGSESLQTRKPTSNRSRKTQQQISEEALTLKETGAA